MIAVDSNLLVYAHRSNMAEHAESQRAISRLLARPGGWGLPLPTIAEFWMVVTHPSASGGPAKLDLAEAFLLQLFEAGAEVLYPGSNFAVRLIRWATQMSIRGPRIYDLQIALAALDAGAGEIWTHDHNFPSSPGLPVYDPLGDRWLSSP